jgi:GTP pyrophosphokinase
MLTDTWVEETVIKFPHLTVATLKKAFELAKKIDPSREKIAYSIAICDELLALNSDPKSIIAAILYPFYKNDQKTKALIGENFDTDITKILLGTKRMETIDQLPIKHDRIIFQHKQLDSLRRMLLAIVDDARIVLIKLAERLTRLTQLREADKETQQQIGNQTMHLYAPLANRLGIGHVKWQLEDWSFRYLEPKKYNEISKALKERRNDRETYIKKAHEELKSLLDEGDIKKYELKGRAKHIYSIFRKINRKQVPISEIYDSNAFRILVSDVEACYRTLSLVHEKWEHIPHEFDDYIAKPKPNGYQSIHTVVIGPDNRNIEIQIRTFAMNEEAELGVAAHWKYKENITAVDAYENKIKLLRDVMNWQEELQPDTKANFFEDRVYVFTPANDILDLAIDSTPLDAAYHIHSEVGHHCKGAKVNHKMVPLTQKLNTGDLIEILTHKQSNPSRDWLNPERGYITTQTARNKVKNWFYREQAHKMLARGLEIWEKNAKREHLSKNVLGPIAPQFNFKTADDLLIAIGSGNVGINTVLRRLKPATQTPEPEIVKIKKPETKTSTSGDIAGTESLLTQLARCCHPIPGDKIIGYITKGRGVSIHRTDCDNIIEAQKNRPERILDVNWSTKKSTKYSVNIEIKAVDNPGLIRDISTLIANENISLLGINSQVDKATNHCRINLTIEIESLEPLHKILTHFKQIPNVINARRV